MKFIITLITFLTLSGCHVTGHNPYNKPAFNGIVIGVITGLIAAQTN